MSRWMTGEMTTARLFAMQPHCKRESCPSAGFCLDERGYSGNSVVSLIVFSTTSDLMFLMPMSLLKYLVLM